MKKILSALVCALFVFITSCGVQSHVQKDPTVDLRNFKTFAWIHEGDSKNGKPYKDFQESYLVDRVTQELEKRGWKKTSLEQNPDALLDYDVIVENDVRRQSEAVYSRPTVRYYYNPYTKRVTSVWYPSQYLGENTYSVPVRSGTITINIVDNRTNKLVWSGWAETEVANKRLDPDELDKIVKSIFKKFNES